ncbi:MAG: type II toxin-antitoxin system HipA family toxin [Alkalilacustris sp.]
MSRADVTVMVESDGQAVPAARLIVEESGRDGAAQLSYLASWLERHDAIPLDPVQLPLEPKIFRTEEDFPLFNGIRDAAPDAWGRKLIDRQMIARAGSPALEQDFLLASRSRHRPGALSFRRTTDDPGQASSYDIGDTEAGPGDLARLIALADVADAGADIPDDLTGWLGAATDMGGARPKATVVIDGFPWIAKISMPSDRIDMVAAEAGCLDLCAMAGLDVPERRIETVGDRRVLLVRRFDRVITGGGLQRIPMISALTLLGAHEMDRGASGYADIRDGLARLGTSFGVGEILFRRMVMNVLCGNTDDHYRNQAFLYLDGGWRMAPTYDVTPTLQVSPSRNLFLHLGAVGSGRSATLQAAIDGAASLGISVEQATAMSEDLAAIVRANWRKVMADRGSSAQDIALMEGSFSANGAPS